MCCFKIKKTEILVLKLVYINYSSNVCQRVVSMCPIMCPDNTFVNKRKVEPSKAQHLCNHGIASYIYVLLDIKVKGSTFYSLYFDESFNDVKQECEMDLVCSFLE